MMIRMGTADTLSDDELLRIGTPDPEAGFGALGTERGNLPLETIDVRSAVVGLTVRTEFALGFRNPYDVALEATYIFPLPDRAAVTGLRMEADGRIIEGVLEERAQARADYETALSEGKRASIAEEERPGVFSMRVGHILPGERVVIRTGLSGRLPFEDGEATYRFPLVVAPRYIPGAPLPGDQVGDGTAPDTDAVPDASRISPPLLLPGFPNPVRLSVEVDVDPAGLPLNSVKSSLHGVEIAEPGDVRGRANEAAGGSEASDGASGRRVIRLLPGNRVDRDFILRLGYGSEDAVTTSLAVRLDEDAADKQDEPPSGTFVLTVLPPSGDAATARPRDVVLVLDRSGSMDGWKMVAARRAAGRIVDTLTSADRFSVLAFDTVVETAPLLPAGLVAATDRHRFRAIEHLAQVEARGGTEMAEPLRQAADLLAAAPGEPRDRVLVLVTDGQVGNEDQILESLAPHLTGVRVHTIGIDRAVNAAFLDRLARVSGGRCELVESEDRLDDAMAQIHRRIGTPVATGLSLVAAGLAVDPASVEPARLPDLFVGAPLVLSGRFSGEPVGAVQVRGSAADGQPWQTSVTAAVSADAGLAAYWARGRVRDLEDGFASGHGDADTERKIVEISLKFGVLCRFTAFVAIDTRVVNQGGAMKRVTQPVDSPSGWDMLDAQADGVFPSALGGAGWTAAAKEKKRHARIGGPVAVSASASAPPMPSLRRAAIPKPGGGPGFGSVPPAPAAPASAAPFMPSNAPSPAPMAQPEPMPERDIEVPDFLREAPADLRARSQGPDLQVRVSTLLERLRTAASASYAERVEQLRQIAAELRQLLLNAPAERIEALSELADDLEQPLGADAADAAELDRRWQHAVTVLAGFSEAPEPQRRATAFWKRRS